MTGMRILASLIRWFKTSNIALVSLSIMVIVTAVIWTMLFVGSGKAVAQQGGETTAVTQAGKAPESAWGLGLLAAAVSTGLSAIAAGIAVAIVGSAAMGAVAERPEVMGRSIISIMILSKL
jgi:V/A-type H+-transporting ATPase subunit K